EEIEDSGGEAFLVRGDLSEEDDRSALIEAVIEQAGRLDILV
ncbi:MAG TPA: short-chain dehydrogenase, partial [Candidatus Poseidoniales archaeon]